MKDGPVELTSPDRRHYLPIVIATLALVLLAGGMGLLFWLWSASRVYSKPISDPGWVLYPASAGSEQEKRPIEENVTLLSLLQTFQNSRDDNYLTDPQAEEFQKARCHVLFGLPTNGVLTFSGSGWSTTSQTSVTIVEVFTPEEGDVPVTTLKLSFQDADRSLSILAIPHVYSLVDGKRVQVDLKDDINFQATAEPGEVFFLRIGSDGRIHSEPARMGERVMGPPEAADVERLFSKAKSG